MSIRIGIYGYGNLGRGVESAIRQNPDMELKAVFTRRDPAALKIRTENVPVVSAADVDQWTDKIDVMILCGGSATDLPVQTPALAEKFTLINSFDTHAKIPEHFAAVDAAAPRAFSLSEPFSVISSIPSAINRIGETEDTYRYYHSYHISQILIVYKRIKQKGVTVRSASAPLRQTYSR